MGVLFSYFLFFFRGWVLFLAWGREYFNGYSEEVSSDSLSAALKESPEKKKMTDNNSYNLENTHKHTQIRTKDFNIYIFMCFN